MRCSREKIMKAKAKISEPKNLPDEISIKRLENSLIDNLLDFIKT